MVKIGNVPVIQGVLTAAFQQRPFSTAAVCEAAIRGAARHNQMTFLGLQMFASLAINACWEVAAPVGSSTWSDLLAAAVSDSSTRKALLLQFGLITTQLLYASSCGGGANVFSSLFHHVLPTAYAIVTLSQLVERTVSIDSDSCHSSSSGSSNSSGEEASVRVQTMLPWIALCGRCLFFAGSQLLLVMQDPAAVRAPGLDERVLEVTQKVLMSILAVLLMVDNKSTSCSSCSHKGHASYRARQTQPTRSLMSYSRASLHLSSGTLRRR